MALTTEITDFKVKNSGKQFGFKMHSISAKWILKDGEAVIREQVFTVMHKQIYTIEATMKKLAGLMICMEKKVIVELSLKVAAEAEESNMLAEIALSKEI